MLVIENATLARLARKPLLTAEFPFIKAAKSLGANCQCTRSPVDVNTIKAQIAGLDHASRERFKKLTGATKVRVYYREGTAFRKVDF